MKLITFLFLFLSFGLCANQIGTFPLMKYHLSSENIVFSQDLYGNILSGTDHGLYIIKEGVWQSVWTGNRKISMIEASSTDKVYLGNPSWFGLLSGDSIQELSSGLFGPTGYDQLHKIIATSTGTYVHLDRKILNLGEDLIEYDYNDIIFAGRLNKDLIIQRDQVGLFLFAGNNFRKINGSEEYAGDSLLDIVDLKDGRFLFLFQNRSIVYDGDNFLPWTDANSDWLSKIDIEHASSNKEGVFLSADSKLFHLDFNGELIRISDLNMRIKDLFVDRDQNIWLSSDNEIISILCSQPFRELNTLAEEGAVLYKEDDLVFIGTKKGSYLTDEFSFLNDGLPRRLSNQSINVIEGDDGQFFFAGDNGLSVYQRGRMQSISTESGSRGVIILENSDHMIEACSSGLNLYENQFGRWVLLNHLYGLEEGTSHFINDERDRLWVLGEKSGVSKLNYDPVLMAINPTRYSLSSGKGEEVNGLFLINGKPIVTTSNNIYEFNETLGRFEKSRIYNDFFGSESDLKYLYQDEYENIWYVSDHEAGVLKVIDKGLEKVTEKIEIPEILSRLNSSSPFVYSFGKERILLGGNDGFLFVDLAKLMRNPSFLMEVYKYTASDRKQKLVSSEWLRNSKASNLLRLNRNVKHLELNLSSSYSVFDSIVNYSYNINDEGWSDKMDRSKLGVELKSGKNNIKVRAHYGFNEVSNTLVIPIIVDQVWFMEEWNQYLILSVLAILVLLIAIVAWMLVRSRNVRISKLQEDFQKTKTELRELREKNEFLGGQLISAMNENNINFQLEKIEKGNDDPEIQKAAKKLAKKLKSAPQPAAMDITPDPDFIAHLKVRYPALTKKDIKLCSLLKMDLTTKDIAPILEITIRGVEISRYRLRKKLDLDNEVVLADFLKEI